MQSFVIPAGIQFSVTPDFLKREGPNGTFYKKTGGLFFRIVTTASDSRLFIEGSSNKQQAAALAHMHNLCMGLSRGFRNRIRLVGIGFRATIQEPATVFSSTAVKGGMHTPKYRRPFLNKASTAPILLLKIGYSHESAFPLNVPNATEVQIKSSRLEGRSKGTIITRGGKSVCKVNQVAADIRAFRYPDAYKGKGMHYDQEVVRLKKGKRQG